MSKVPRCRPKPEDCLDGSVRRDLRRNGSKVAEPKIKKTEWLESRGRRQSRHFTKDGNKGCMEETWNLEAKSNRNRVNERKWGQNTECS